MVAHPILVLNAGSSSLKFSLYEADGSREALRLHGEIEGLGGAARFLARAHNGTTLGEQQWSAEDALDHQRATEFVLGWVAQQKAHMPLAGVGHRVVHGGERFAQPVRVDGRVLGELESLIPLAPLHQPHNLLPMRAILQRSPQLAQVACFDTAFHRTQPAVARAFALPPEITRRGVRRFGFHGLSYEYIASVLPTVDARAARGRCIVAHLGNGASLCALAGGVSIATTMGFTPLDGLPMGTRCGSVDPGVVLYLMDELGYGPREIEDILYHRSGLAGVSGISSDMRTLLTSADPRAAAAIDLFVYRIARELGSLAAALGGLDALIFTAGIGENSSAIRARVCRDAAWLGVVLDETANRRGAARISTDASPVAVHVVPTDEERMIMRHVREVLQRT